jgi:RHS repeat-associated protein
MLEIDARGATAYAVDPLGVTSRHGAAGRRYAHHGLHASVVALTDDAGAAVATYDYDAWGALRSAPAERFLYGYGGERTDPDTGYVWLRSRWYDPATGVFLGPDGAPAVDADPRTLHRYAYAPQGAPLNLIDPDGGFSLVEINISTAISTTLQALRTAAIACARRAAIGLIRDAIFDFVTQALLTSVFGGLQAAFLGFIDRVIAGENIGDFLRDFFCNAAGAALPGFGDAVRFEVPINSCGGLTQRLRRRGGRMEPPERFDCSRRPPPGHRPITARGGTAIDVLLNETIPIEMKSGADYDEQQLLKYCRFAARAGSHIVIAMFGNWPPFPDGGELRARGWKKRQRLQMAGQCAICFDVRIGTAGRCRAGQRVAFGSALVYVGFDRRRRRLRAELPKVKGLCEI